MGKMSSLWVEMGNCAKTDPAYKKKTLAQNT